MITDYPVHWLVCSMGKTGSRYKRIAFTWALNFLFKDYCLLPAEFFKLIFNRYHAEYPLTVLRSMLDWLKSPVGSDRFRPVTAGRLTREMADRFTSYLHNDKGIVKGRGIALLQYLRARYHSAVTSEQGLVRVAEMMVMLSLPMSLNKDAVEDTSRYNWFMAMHLLYGYGYGQRSLRDLEHLYRVFPEHSVITVTRWPALLLWVVRVCLLRWWISGTLSEALHLQTITMHWRCTRFCAA